MGSHRGRSAASSDRHGRASRAGTAPGDAAVRQSVGGPRGVAERLSSLLRREPAPTPAPPPARVAAPVPDPMVEGLRAKERFLSTLLDNLPGYAYRCRNDRAWTIEFISDGVRKVTGYAPADFQDGRVSIGLDLIHPDHRARVWHVVQDALARGEVFQCTYPITTADGHLRWMWEQGRAVHGCHGTFEALEGFVSDVTERVLAEQALSERDRTLESAQEVAHVGHWSRRCDAPERVHWSAEMARIFGVDPAGFDGGLTGYFAMVHPDDLPRVRAAHDRARRGEAGFDLEYRVLRRDGALRWVHDRGEVVRDERGQVQRTMGVCQDITEQTELRATLAQTKTNEALGRLAGGIAHDFNNLLQVLQSCTETLLAGTPAHDARHDDLQQIREVGERAGRLTEQLLALGGRQPLRLMAVDVPGLIARMLPQLAQAVGQAVRVEFAAPPEACCAQADAALLEQVFRDLCLYGRGVLPRGGRLSLRAALVEADERFQHEHGWAGPGRFVALTLTATAANAADPTPNVVTAGAGDPLPLLQGLGLEAVRCLVAQLGGRVESHAAEGEGADVCLYLPASQRHAVSESVPRPEHGAAPRRHPEEAAAATAATPAPHVAGGRPTVLFAEDDRLVCEQAARTLREAGFDVLLAHDGGQALACFDARRGDVDVVVLDIVMPVLDGARVRDEIARRDPAARVILTTGYGPDALEEDNGVSLNGRVLQKPYPPARLVSAVREALAPAAG